MQKKPLAKKVVQVQSPSKVVLKLLMTALRSARKNQKRTQLNPRKLIRTMKLHRQIQTILLIKFIWINMLKNQKLAEALI